MKKLLKYTGLTLLALLLIAIVSLFLLAHFVLKPDVLKPIIHDQAKATLGRDVVINGDLSWTIYPAIGISMHDLVIGNPSTFKQKEFAHVKNATLSVKLLPLLHKHIESNGIVLSGVDIHLIKKASGETNWDFTTGKTSAAPKSTTDESATQSNAANLGLGLSIAGVNIHHANLIYSDEKTNKTYKITDFNLALDQIQLDKPFPLSTDFTLHDESAHLTTAVILTANIALQLEQKRYTLRNIKLASHIQQDDKKINVTMHGDIIADLNAQSLTWQHFDGEVENLSWHGKMIVSQLTTAPMINGQVMINPFDLKTLLQKMGIDTTSLQQANPVLGKIDFSAGVKGLHANSHVEIANLKASKINLDHVRIDANLHDNKLNITQLTANLYQGTLSAQGAVNFAGAIPHLQWQAKLTHVQAGAILQDLSGKKSSLKLTGLANAALQISTAGKEKPMLLQNLNGQGNFSLNNGTFEGVDLAYWLDQAYAKVQKQATTTADSKKTNFGNLTASFQIKSGVINNNDLVMTSPRFITKGSGTIDLINQRIHYGLQTTMPNLSKEQKNDLRNLYGLPVPILITGSLDNPSVTLDIDTLLAAVAKQQVEQVKDKALDRVRDKVEQAIPNAGKVLEGLFH